MALIKSISGIRGTIGGRAGDGLSPLDIVKFTSAYATYIRRTTSKASNVIVVGRDARLSGRMVLNMVVGTLTGMGFDVVNIGLATTPTTELAVVGEQACGGIIITASHNPKQWNALKLLNEQGEFLTDEQGKEVLRIAQAEDFDYADVDHLGREQKNYTYLRRHIEQVLALPLVDVEAIRQANFTVAVDAVNSVGGVAIPKLLEALGVKQIEKLYCDPTGNFGHTPEPIPENLTGISEFMRQGKADVGFVVDPDVDRLAIVRGVHLGGCGRLCVESHSWSDGEQSVFVTSIARCDRAAWLHLHRRSSGRGQCHHRDASHRSRHWWRGQRWSHLS